jgi:secreted trypsin-like serine protease
VTAVAPVAMGEILDQQRAVQALKQLGTGEASELIVETQQVHAGLRKRPSNGRILGGKEATPLENPWQVALLVSWLPSNVEAQFCGGSYRGGRWVITAAHCVEKRTHPEQVDLLIGSNDLASGGLRVKAVKILIHPHWDPAKKDSDIALVQFDATPTQLTALGNKLQKIDLLTAAHEGTLAASTVIARISGWGLTGDGSAVPPRLREAPIPLVSRDICKDPVVYGDQFTDTMICAGTYSGSADSCQGDSGGPLTVVSSGSQRALAGIVSWGDGCGRPGHYGVYTRVTAFTKWVSDNAK